jgi:hypothetical protein
VPEVCPACELQRSTGVRSRHDQQVSQPRAGVFRSFVQSGTPMR